MQAMMRFPVRALAGPYPFISSLAANPFRGIVPESCAPSTMDYLRRPGPTFPGARSHEGGQLKALNYPADVLEIAKTALIVESLLQEHVS